jgi:hypothetical protein
MLLQLSIIYDWQCFNIDTISAFLHQKRPKSAIPIYTRIEKSICEICNLDSSQYYLINKYIYGLPDSGKAYYEAVKHLLTTKFFFKMSIVDNCLYYFLDKLYNIYIIIYVDDTYIFSNNVEGLAFAKTVFQSEFPIQNSDPSNYLGIHISKK